MHSDNVTLYSCQHCSHIKILQEATHNDRIKIVRIEIDHVLQTGS